MSTKNERAKKNSEKLIAIKEALGNIINDLDEICADELELLEAMSEDSPRYSGKELVIGCIEHVSEKLSEGYEVLESLLEG